jgi:hypothetical protein
MLAVLLGFIMKWWTDLFFRRIKAISSLNKEDNGYFCISLYLSSTSVH